MSNSLSPNIATYRARSLLNIVSKISLATTLTAFACSAAYAEHHNEVPIPTDAASTVESFEKLFGVTKGKRRNHTKGFCFDGSLVPTDKSVQLLSSSALFADDSKVVGRLSHKGGNNNAADDSPAEYGLGLSIATAAGATHLMSMNTLDFFPVATPEAFALLMHAKAAGGDAVKNFKAGNKNLQRFSEHGASKTKVLTPYEGSTFNSINSFYLVNADDEKTAIRWSFEPVNKQELVIDASENFFFENLQKNLDDHEVAWNMVVTVANPEDDVDNAAIAWDGEHKTFVAAKLTINSIASEQDGKCDLINFDPLVLAPGFEASADPLLQARRNTYAIGLGKRLSEKE